MKLEMEKKVAQALKGIVCFDSVTFVESKKFKNSGKSLYLVFAVHNAKTGLNQRASFCVLTKSIDLTFWPVIVK